MCIYVLHLLNMETIQHLWNNSIKLWTMDVGANNYMKSVQFQTAITHHILENAYSYHWSINRNEWAETWYFINNNDSFIHKQMELYRQGKKLTLRRHKDKIIQSFRESITIRLMWNQPCTCPISSPRVSRESQAATVNLSSGRSASAPGYQQVPWRNVGWLRSRCCQHHE